MVMNHLLTGMILQVCLKKGISPIQSYSGDGIETINSTWSGGVRILRDMYIYILPELE